MKICILGNSKRNLQLYRSLKTLGYTVNHYIHSKDLPEQFSHKVVILPIPTLNGYGKLNIEEDCSLTPEELFERFESDALFITCNYESEKYRTVDINKRDDFAYMNAIPTAEGAIYHAIKESDTSLFNQKILITGFGRVAKLLADRIKGLACDVTIAARSQKDKAYAHALGFKTVEISSLKDIIKDIDIIFQTVPSPIIDRSVIDSMPDNLIIIELSSKSIGTDYNYAKQNGISVIHAAALPEKIAPITAGNILTETILNILDEQMPKSGDLFEKR